jgi:hypothetical protein
MDTVTISALVFVLIMSLAGTVLRKEHSLWTVIAMVLVETFNFLQFGYFSGLWPFTMMGVIYVVVIVSIVIIAAVLAYKDAKDAR